MSQAPIDVRSVKSCVAEVVAAFHDASQVLNQAKASRTDTRADERLVRFEDSLMLGPPIIQGFFEENVTRLGDAFANGDQKARETLKEIVINLQLTLKVALMDEAALNFPELQEASDDSRIKAILCLSNLSQRIADRNAARGIIIPQNISKPTQDSFSNPNDSSSGPKNRFGRSSIATTSTTTTSNPSSSMARSPDSNNYKAPHNRLAELDGSEPWTRDGPNKPLNQDTESIYSEQSSSNNSGRRASGPPDQSQPIPIPMRNPWAPTIEPDIALSPTKSDARRSSHCSSNSSSRENPNPSSPVTREKRLSLTARASHILPIQKWRSSTGTAAPKPDSQLTNPPPPGIYLPGREHDYDGFCKGAWKLQAGADGAFRLTGRPVGMYMITNSWHCCKCDFEGIVQESKSVDTDKTTAMSSILGPVKPTTTGNTRTLQMFDQTVHLHGPSGNRYRWIFLAKSHAQYKAPTRSKAHPEEVVGSFGCIFCSSINEGPAPIFGNLDTFMAHLREHGGRGFSWDRKKPSKPLLEYTNCIIGRVASDKEHFDINIPTVAEMDGE